MSSFLSNPLVIKKISDHFEISDEAVLGPKHLGEEGFKQIFDLDLLAKVETWLDDLYGLSEPEDKAKLLSHKSYKKFAYMYKEITKLNEVYGVEPAILSDSQDYTSKSISREVLYGIIIFNAAYNSLEYSYHGPFGHGTNVDTTNEIYEVIDFMTTDLVAANKVYEDGFYNTEFQEKEYLYWGKLFEIFNQKEQ